MQFLEENRKAIVWVVCSVVILISLLGGCNAFYKKTKIPADNSIEQLIEEKIKEETGIEIDLSP